MTMHDTTKAIYEPDLAFAAPRPSRRSKPISELPRPALSHARRVHRRSVAASRRWGWPAIARTRADALEEAARRADLTLLRKVLVLLLTWKIRTSTNSRLSSFRK